MAPTLTSQSAGSNYHQNRLYLRTPGVSNGILHHGKVIRTAGFGYRNVQAKLEPGEHTIFHVASLSKAMTSMAVAALVNEGKFWWNSTVKSLLPEFCQKNLTIQQEATVTDLLAHRLGLTAQNQWLMQEHGRISVLQKETMPIVATLPRVYDFGSEFLYNNWGYCVAAVLIQRVSNLNWGEFLQENIFKPLGITRTTTVRNPEGDNIAKGYIALEDGSPFPNKWPYVSNGTIMSGAAGVQTTVHDLLQLYGAVLKASHDQFQIKTSSTEGSPLKELPTIMASHMSIGDTSTSGQSYRL
ncbi:hypothetical protein G7Y89_g15783 [Cudoniella acicularis]|uniref:Beta-lactamase-related domain-containing protein n=1 Tax=Cudoniella acicularis TaxID=354080 RepID=A0A8H4VJ78_9HELO|nr:hypothetical protein G7Y89_g15783 [Cudoniella acicularis]